MPLVAHSELPTFTRLRGEGHEVLDIDRARHQDIRELHIGLLNLMPDAALQATERQFMRLLGSSNRIVQLYVHPFTVSGVPRAGRALAHVQNHYENFTDLQAAGLDALVVTGANPANPDITREGYWPGMIEVLEWAVDNVCSTLCSCLATHAALKHFHGVQRIKLPRKRWGVYPHDIVNPAHPLVTNINTRFDAPHSHLNEVTSAQARDAGCMVLVSGAQGANGEAIGMGADLHLATSGDGFRFVYFHGHPEYDVNSLLKEYKRETERYRSGERGDYPPPPENYFNKEAAAVAGAYKKQALQKTPAEFPEKKILPHLHNTWTDTGKAIFNNWLGLVYQTTNQDRKKLFMDGVDGGDPLGLAAQSKSAPVDGIN